MAATNHVGTPEQSFTVERSMPYGFWVIKPSRGRVADPLKGRYTYSAKAIEDIERLHPEATIKVTY